MNASVNSARIVDSIIKSRSVNVLHIASTETESSFARITLSNRKGAVATLDTLVNSANADMHIQPVYVLPSVLNEKPNLYVVFEVSTLVYAAAELKHKIIGFDKTYGEDSTSVHLAIRAWDDYAWMTYSKKDGYRKMAVAPTNADSLLEMVKRLWNRADKNRAFPGDQRSTVMRRTESGFSPVTAKDTADSTWMLSPYGRFHVTLGRKPNKAMIALYTWQTENPAK